MSEKPEVLTPHEVGQILRLDVYTVRRLLRTGEMPGFKVGDQWRIPRDALDKFMKKPVAA